MIITSQSDWDTFICQDLHVQTKGKLQNVAANFYGFCWRMILPVFFFSISIGRRWYLPKRKATHLFLAMTVPLALLCQPRGFAISMGIWQQSPNKSAGAGRKKASVDERSETVDKIFMFYGVQLPQYPFFSVLATVLATPCSRYSWPQVLKSFIFFMIGDRATGTLHLVRYGKRRQSPSAHTYSLCVCVCVWGGFVYFEAVCDLQNDALLSLETTSVTSSTFLPEWEPEVEA